MQRRLPENVHPRGCKPELSHWWLRIWNTQVLGYLGPIARCMASHSTTGSHNRSTYCWSLGADKVCKNGEEANGEGGLYTSF